MTARFERLGLADQLILIGMLSSLVLFLFPIKVDAQVQNKTRLVFEIKNFPTIAIPDIPQVNDVPALAQATEPAIEEQPAVPVVDPRIEILRNYLESKNSPLAPSAEHILKHQNWKLVLAISNGESTMCKRQMYNNCWGVGGAWNLKRYKSLEEAFTDVNRLLTEKYVARGADAPAKIVNRYVGHPNANWVLAVNQVLNQLNQLPLEN